MSELGYYLKTLFTGPITWKLLGSSLLAIFTHIAGADWLAYEILFILVIIDSFTGVAAAINIKQKISSRRFFRTGYKLLLYFSLIIAAHQLVRITGLIEWVETFMVLFLASTELLSIIENAHKLGIPIPAWVSTKIENTINAFDGNITKTK